MHIVVFVSFLLTWKICDICRYETCRSVINLFTAALVPKVVVDSELSHWIYSCCAQFVYESDRQWNCNKRHDFSFFYPQVLLAEVRMRVELIKKCQIFSKFICVCHLFDWLGNIRPAVDLLLLLNHKTIQNARVCFASIH